MRKRTRSPLRMSLLSYAVAVAAAGIAQSALAVDLCTGKTTISVTSGAADNNCTLDTTGAKVTIGSSGKIDQGIYASVESAQVTNSGVVSDDTTAIWYAGVGLTGTISNGGTIKVDTADNEAYALWVDGDVSGSIRNSGRILAAASTSSSYASAYALYAGGLSGTLTNSGSIVAEADGSYYAFANALEIDGDASGSVTNSGRITATATANSEASAFAVLINGELSGEFINSGTISASAVGGTDAYASALYISGDVSAAIVNRGTISASAHSDDSRATANAIYLSSSLDAVLTNAGRITAMATSLDSYADATALHVSGDITSSGGLVNTGVISASATADDSSASAYGVMVGGVASATLSNTGTISAQASGEEDAASYAIAIWGGLADGGKVQNRGTLSASAGSGTDDADAYGLRLGSRWESAYGWVSMTGNAQVLNSGTISVSANGRDADAYVAGIGISGAMVGTASLVNAATGLISARAYSEFSSATATGVYTGNMDNQASLVNNGRILATATSLDGSAYAYGVYAGSLAGGASILNTGTIAATAEAYDSASATGLHFGYMNGYLLDAVASVTNSGAISAVARSEDSDATAYGLRGYSISGDAMVTNNGRITAEAHGWSEASAAGIYIEGVYDGASVANNGTITAKATDWDSSATAYAVRLDGMSEGSFINNGTLTAEAHGLRRASASAYGVYAYDLDNSALVNNGAITAVATAVGPDDSADAYGIYTGSLYGSSVLANAGRITVSATAEGYSASAYGIEAGNVEDDSVLSNSGRITVTAVSTGSSASAYGIYASSVSGNGVVSNSGIINVSANAGGDEGEAYGMRVSGISDDAIVENTGSITVSAHGMTSAQAYGMYAGSLYGAASLSNSGSLRVSAVNQLDSTASAWGVLVDHVYDTASITNSGVIVVNASDLSGRRDNTAYAYGISGQMLNSGATITNSGVISVSADSLKGDGSAYGIYIRAIGGTITNTGLIDVRGTTDGQVYGIYASGGWVYDIPNATGLVDNSGVITGGVYLNRATDYLCTWSCFTTGDYVTTSLTNSGLIVTHATSPSYVSGDYTQGTGGVLGFLMRDTSAYGRLEVAGTADFTDSSDIVVGLDPRAALRDGDTLYGVVSAGTLVSPDGFTVTDTSRFWDFESVLNANSLDLIAHAISPTQALAGSGLKLTGSQATFVGEVVSGGYGGAYEDLSGALNSASSAAAIAAILEQAGPALSGAVAHASRIAGAGASNAISARMGETRGASSGDAFTSNSVWIKPFVGMAEQDAENGVSGFDVDSSGFVIGMDGDVSDALRVGVAIAAAQSDVEGGVANVDIDTTQFTLYGSYALGSATALDVDLSYGSNRYDSTRRIAFNGSTAVGAFDGTQLALGLGLEHRISLGDDAALLPALTVRYTQLDLDGYSETGAGLYNLTVADSDEDSLLAVAKASYERKLGKGTLLASLGVGVDTADTASATVRLGATGPTFVSNGIEPESTLVTGGLGYRYVTAKNLEINAAWDVESRSNFLGNSLSVKFRLPF